MHQLHKDDSMKQPYVIDLHSDVQPVSVLQRQESQSRRLFQIGRPATHRCPREQEGNMDALIFDIPSTAPTSGVYQVTPSHTNEEALRRRVYVGGARRTRCVYIDRNNVASHNVAGRVWVGHVVWYKKHLRRHPSVSWLCHRRLEAECSRRGGL